MLYCRSLRNELSFSKIHLINKRSIALPSYGLYGTGLDPGVETIYLFVFIS